MPLECECIFQTHGVSRLGQMARNENPPVKISGAASIFELHCCLKGNGIFDSTNSWQPWLQGVGLSLNWRMELSWCFIHTGLSEPTLFLDNLGKWEQLPSCWGWSTSWDFLGHYSSDKLLHLRVSLECILFIKKDITRRVSLQGLRNNSFRVSFLAK